MVSGPPCDANVRRRHHRYGREPVGPGHGRQLGVHHGHQRVRLDVADPPFALRVRGEQRELLQDGATV